ncbi:MAG: peptidoglycan-associated lipoprotein Pal [Nitrospiraceae bacterium]|nr:MAG: peptidoglycan-associated lipoprotein Pal [Nitrospiraceae bacterium]
MKKILIIALLVFAVSCAKKYTKPYDEPARAPEEPISEETIEIEEEQVEEVEIPRDQRIEEEDMASREMTAEEKAQQIFQDILFDYDKYDIRAEARPVLDSVASFLNDEKDLNIAIEGHCDERGTNEYNLALGEKRANSTKNYLVSLGITPDRITVVTYGEEKQLCVDQNEDCWQLNRRAHFVVLK